MDSKPTLRTFLDSHPATGIWTHVSLAGGKYFIPDEELTQFYDLYAESILDGNKEYLAAKSTDIGPLRLDFDFIYSADIKAHIHTQSQVIQFSLAYMQEIQKYLELPLHVDLHVQEKRRPTYDATKHKVKSGIHIQVPTICTHKFVEQRVRRTLLKRMDEFFSGLPLEEPWEKVYDEGVVNRTVPWTMYGSRKKDSTALPYLTVYILRYNSETKGIELISEVPKFTSTYVRDMSLRRLEVDETLMTAEGKSLYSGVRDKIEGDIRISGSRPTRGRPLSRTEKAPSRGSSPNGRIFQHIDPEKKEYLKMHVMNLQPSRSTKYETWVQVGICLHNIHPDLLDVFLDFSSQDELKYNEADCIQKWNSLTFRNDGDRIGEGTLRYWSREDNREGYEEIEKTNVDRLVMSACSCTEHDVASVIYAKYRDAYKCCDFKNNIWYRWTGHIWRETDSGIDLLSKLSKHVAELFYKEKRKIVDEKDARKLLDCTGDKDGKKDCGICEYCQLTQKEKQFTNVFMKLKTTSFKSNIMKECRELFFDEEFAKKIDSAKDLIAFNNGVLDMTKEEFVFRDGKPEDYISFSTGIDYDTHKQYYEYPEWSRVENFLFQVLPDPEVRDYFLKHLASNLRGGNTAQKFHIMTGSGSNGKSMIMNLMSKALGDYACTVPISLFTQKRKGSGAAAPEVARLRGRRFVTMQEPDESIALNTGLMKEITSGEKMYARDLFKSGSEFEVLAKFHLACNEKPKINTTDGGTWRRLVVINFVSKFVPHPSGNNEYPLDESIQFCVNSTEWGTPFLNYLVKTLQSGKGLHKLSAPQKVLEYTSEYRNENDGIAKFIADRIVSGDSDTPVDKITLKRIFREWKNDNDQKELLASELEKRLEQLFGPYKRGGWMNFRLE